MFTIHGTKKLLDRVKQPVGEPIEAPSTALGNVDWHAERNGVGCVYWIDGNHENHDALAEVDQSADGTVAINDRCRYLPRGLRWEWRGVRFGALGGAFSVDRRERVEGESWWAGEITSDADVQRLGEDPLDVLVTHDAPDGVPLKGLGLPVVNQVLADEVRARLRSAVESTEPNLLLHGHWHHRYSHELTWPTHIDGELVWRSTQVEGLAADVQRDRRAWAILELEPMRFIEAKALA